MSMGVRNNESSDLAATHSQARHTCGSHTGVVRQAARYWNVHHSTVQYWKKKADNPVFHSGSWGGSKSSKFSPEQQELWRAALWTIVQTKNQMTLKEMSTEIMRTCNLQVELGMIHRQLRKWKITLKVAFPIQRAKYTFHNIMYYISFVRWYASLESYVKLKVMDESHFDGRSKPPLVVRKCLKF